MTKTAVPAPADDSDLRARLVRALAVPPTRLVRALYAPIKGLKNQVFGRFFNRLFDADKLSPTWPYPPGSYTLVDNGITMTRRYHIRQLSDAGPKFGGGIDTPPLCEQNGEWDRGWFDKPQPVDEFALGEACKDCAAAYRARVS